ncbi:cytochrome B [Epidermidibacterium keratini]|uniref:cytochrome-c oxidase n=1 Tax=Epidermidibacterium keratini TaxID=1891644 RepID=A0A7L4YT54_9ACTN|nr:cytochrome B [Epidermidibacterium keratini]
MTRVTTATPAFESEKVHSLSRPNLVSVGTVVWLSSELMFFAGLFAMFFTSKAIASTEQWAEWSEALDPIYALIFTIILVASSVTCQFGVFAAERGDVYGLRKWYAISFVLGAIFVGGQVNEYIVLVSEGTTISANAFGSVFFITTGFHGLHVAGGLVAFLIILARSTMGRFTPAQATSAIVVSYYWHFVDVVWIGLFTIIYVLHVVEVGL